LAQSIALAAQVGFTELEGFDGVYADPSALRQLIDKHGLSMPTGHFGFDMLENQRPRLLKTAEILGIRHIYAPFIPVPERPPTASGWRKLGKRLSGLGDWVRSEGYSFGWHNHDFEFMRLPSGEIPIDIMFEAAPMLDWEIDVAWLARAGVSPTRWIRKYGQRITAVHVKDLAPRGENPEQEGWADAGQGTVDWPAVFKALRNTRMLHVILEHDKPGDLERFARRSFEHVKSILKAPS
jgi:sugar phosphate isomerase/epimerase